MSRKVNRENRQHLTSRGEVKAAYSSLDAANCSAQSINQWKRRRSLLEGYLCDTCDAYHIGGPKTVSRTVIAHDEVGGRVWQCLVYENRGSAKQRYGRLVSRFWLAAKAAGEEEDYAALLGRFRTREDV